jgi:hypothetical protein
MPENRRGREKGINPAEARLMPESRAIEAERALQPMFMEIAC